MRADAARAFDDAAPRIRVGPDVVLPPTTERPASGASRATADAPGKMLLSGLELTA